MPELFTLEELVTFLQVPSLETDIATLARDLVTYEFRAEIGAARYDALTDLTPFKALALVVAKRVVFNPEGLRSEKIDDYEYTIAAEDLRAPELTEDERRRIRKRAGIKSAFSIAPSRPRTYTCCRRTGAECLCRPACTSHCTSTLHFPYVETC